MTWEMAAMGTAGGVMIGLASLLLLLAGGRIAGISGIVGGLLTPDGRWRAFFLLGLAGGGALMFALKPEWFANTTGTSLPMVAIAGLAVGFGTRLGSGCTSGHGVCGVSRLSSRSIVATLVFVGTGIITVAAFGVGS
jgi:uncharacterized membrane protein YedE/YeeE